MKTGGPRAHRLLTNPALSEAFPMTQGLIDHLGREERSLLQRHGVRLRVDGITRDGRYALCSTCQVKRSFLRPMLSNIALVAIAHRAFAKLNLFGMQTLISVVPKGPLTVFPAVDPHDPFQLCEALATAALMTTVHTNAAMVIAVPSVSCAG
jgi:hypothetical protein